MSSADNVVDLVAEVNESLQAVGRRSRLLNDIAWPRSVEEKFFADGANALPEIEYTYDRPMLQERAERFAVIVAKIEGDEPERVFLRDTVQSYADANRLLLAVGTTEYYRISRELYGGARTRFIGTNTRNIDLAEHLLERLSIHGYDPGHPKDDEEDPPVMDAQQFCDWLTEQSRLRNPHLPLVAVVDEDLSAKVIAGRERIRVRGGAQFGLWEAEGLWAHEVETHALTAQNGAAQAHLPFLAAGGPRTTRTQEGLAVFSELDARRMSPARMERLALRVKLVAMAEDGADFLDLYRFLTERGAAKRDAYLDAQRVCRGGKVTGGAPFTKDSVYLAGLVEVFTFLSTLARGGHRDEIELITVGRIAIEDLEALVRLRRAGLVSPPMFTPPWLHNWRGLLPYFSFLSFVHELSLSGVESRFANLVKLASEQSKSYPPGDLQSAAGGESIAPRAAVNARRDGDEGE